MACSGTRERDLARKYNLKCLSVHITKLSKKQLDFYQINLEKCTQQVLQLGEVKSEESGSFSETAVKCLIQRETSDYGTNLHHVVAMDHSQDDLENALTSELIIKSEECSSKGEELENTDDSCIRQNVKADSISPNPALDGLQNELIIKSKLECSEGNEIQENAGSKGGNLRQDCCVTNMACSGTRERDLARKYNLKCLSVHITKLSKKQLDFYQINFEKCTQQVLQLGEVKSEETESFSKTAVKCLIQRETSDYGTNLHHVVAMDHSQDDLENALTSELIIKSEECSREVKELENTDDSCIRQNLKAESISTSQAENGLQDELIIKSELECRNCRKDTQESAGSEGGNLCQACRRNVNKAIVSAAVYQQICEWVKFVEKATESQRRAEIEKKILLKSETLKQKKTQSKSIQGKKHNIKCLNVNIIRMSQTESDKLNKDSENVNNVQAASELEQTKVQPYSCHVRDKTLSCRGYLKQDMRGVHKAVCLFHCNLCSKDFISKLTFNQHLKVQSNERPFKCKKCSMCFKFKAYLREHSKNVHSIGKSFACEVCGKMFKCKTYLKAHNLTVHAVELKFKCGDCNKKFKSNVSLFHHKKSHSTLRPFECDKCNKKFKVRAHIIKHMSVHSDVRPFSCEICAKSFKCKYRLKQHCTVHISLFDFTCNLCPTKFKHKRGLLRHKKTVHSDARCFNCYDCGKSFKLKSNVQRHMASHINLRQFQCKQCDKKFNLKDSLTRHSLVHSKPSALP